LRVAIDIDGVTRNFQDHWIELYQHWFDTEVDTSKTGEWDALTEATHFKNGAEFFDWFNRAKGWATMPYMPGACGALFEMQALDIKFLFCTSRPAEAAAVTSHQASMDWNAVVQFANTQSKHLAKADIWIDDSPEVLRSLAKNKKQTIRFAQPWNKGVRATWTANNWREVLAILKEEM
jgi:5'(3')-deoxyribonucleotidase